MTTTVVAKIIPRQGTAAEWTAANPTLLFGERGVETDTGYVKLGDGTTAWNDLDYAATEGTVAAHIASTSNPHSVTAAQTGALTAAAADLVYAPIANGVTGGDSHDHSGGDGAQIAYSGLSGLPTLGTAAATAATDYATAVHAHGNLTNAGAIGSTANLPVITSASGVLAAGAFGTGATDFCVGNDSRLSDARTPTAHSHEGTAILSTGETGGAKFLREDGDGTSSWQTVTVHDAVTIADSTSIDLTLTGQQISAAAIFGTTAGTVCQGNDARLSDARTPSAHSHEGTAILSTGETGGTKYLREDGDGTCSWQTVSAGGDLVNDTTPQLGGDLDLNGNQITGSGGTVTTSQPVIDVSQTWNDGAVTFTGIKANITDTASAAASLLMDLQVGGSSKVSIDKAGSLTVPYGTTANPAIILGANGKIYTLLTGYQLVYRVLNNNVFSINATYGANVQAAGSIGFSPTTDAAYISPDVRLRRDDAGILAQRDGTNAQTYRLYNTYTDASNYERLSLKWDSNVCIITTAAAGTGTLRGLKIGEAVTSLVGFYGVTPVVQQASADQAVVTLGNANSEIGDLTFSSTPTQGECQALRDKCEELADDVRALSTLVHSLRTALLNVGLIKGAA